MLFFQHPLTAHVWAALLKPKLLVNKKRCEIIVVGMDMSHNLYININIVFFLN